MNRTPGSIEVVTPPAEEPVSLDELKLQTRVDNAEEDALLSSYIAAAREAFEHLTDGRVIVATTYREHFASWGELGGICPPWAYGRTLPLQLRLSRAKVSSISSVK